MNKYLLLFLSLIAYCKISAQHYHFEEPIRLNSNVNQKSEDTFPLYDKETKTLYFARIVHKSNKGGKFSGFDIWYSKRRSETFFERAKNLKELNDQSNNVVIGFKSEGKGLYLQNAYDSKSNQIVTGISYSLANENGFEPPQTTEINSVYNMGKNEFWGAYINDANDVLLLSMKGSQSVGQEDLYVSFKFTGQSKYYDTDSLENNSWWSEPIHLGNVINSYKFEISPFLLDDGRTLFFASDRPGGMGDSDIYYSRRLDDTWQNWSEPVNLGEPINTTKFEGYFSLTRDGEAFYSSTSATGLADIYLTKILAEDSLANIKEEEQYLDSINSTQRLISFKDNDSNLLMADYQVFKEAVSILETNRSAIILLDAFKTEDSTIVDSRIKNTLEQFYMMGVDSSRVTYDEKVFNSLENTIGIKFYKSN